MVAKRAVVRVLLDSHNLYAVIAFLDDTWEDILAELLVRAHLLSILRHTDVALIDEQRSGIWLESLLLPLILLFRSPHLSREYLGLIILHHSANPCWDALALTTIPLYKELEEVAVLESFSRKFYLPVLSVLQFLHGILLILFPVIEVAYEVNLGGIGSPLTEYPSLVSLMQTVIEIASSKLG